MVNSDKVLKVSIVGLGPRGLVILERLLSLAPLKPEQELDIVVFEPGVPGVGVHSIGQPPYLMLNTIACQLSMFPDGAALRAAPPRHGPNFYQWCHERAIHLDEWGQVSAAAGRPVLPTDYLPRRLLGQYLAWTFSELCSSIPANCQLRVIAQEVMDIEQAQNGEQFVLHGASGYVHVADRVFLTVGHTGRESPIEPRRIRNPYPLPDALSGIGTGSRVALAGFGLCAMDALAVLTVGRGGVMIREPGRPVRYEPSGREPHIVLYSRSGLPFYVRPETDTERRKPEPWIFTPQRIESMRRNVPNGQFDFEAELLPLLQAEMELAYYLRKAHLAGGQSVQAAQRIAARISESRCLTEMRQLMSELAQMFGQFSIIPYFASQAPCTSGYRAWFQESICIDLAEGAKGLGRSPLKAALETVRDLRDVLRQAVDFHGLTDTSHRVFYTRYVPLFNRFVGGPQRERYEDLLALLDAGVASLLPGVNPKLSQSAPGEEWTLELPEQEFSTRVDYLVDAALPSSGLFNTDSSLLNRLHQRNWLQPRLGQQGVDGVDVDLNGNVSGLASPAAANLWLFGPAVEGSTFYNHYVPSAGGYSRAFSDAQHAVSSCLGLVGQYSSEPVRVREGLSNTVVLQ